jgi:hypothetical protein
MATRAGNRTQGHLRRTFPYQAPAALAALRSPMMYCAAIGKPSRVPVASCGSTRAAG